MSVFRLLLIASLLVCSTAPRAADFRIEDIRVEGLQRTSAGTVFNYLPIEPGGRLTTERAQQAIRALYKTGFFEDVRLEQDGDVLVIQVRERPAIAAINIDGNKSIETEDLKKGLEDQGLAAGRTFNRSVLDGIEQELRRQYFNQGRYGVQLTTTPTPLERNRVAINIDIVEGETAAIKGINIVGNRTFAEEDLLAEFDSGVGAWWDFFGSSDQYSKQKLAGDLEKLRSYYLDRGYVNFRVVSTQVGITPDKKDIYITINVDEGEVFTISDITLAGNLVQNPEDFFPLIQLVRGEPFSRKLIVESSDRINALLSDRGYAFANVNSIPEIDNDNKQVAVTFFVDPGKRVYVRRINVIGNHRTRDRVIRRELRQMESTWFSNERINLSRERLQRTGFFETVSVETPTVPGSTDELDVDLTVKEKASGALLAGIGFSQTSGIVFNTSLTENNFFGSGKRVTFAFNNSSASTHYELGVFDPYYTVDGISRGFNAGYRTTDYDQLNAADYTTDIGNLDVTFGLPLSEFNRFNFGLGAEHIRLKANITASNEVKNFIAREGDKFLNFKLNGSWKHDSRDTAIFPNRGGLQKLALEMAVPGSDLQFYKANYENRYYFPIAEDLVFSLAGELGYGDGYGSTSKLPFFENYFGGGFGTVRGYRTNTLGPRDSNGDPLGGNLLVAGNAEILFPMPADSLKDSVRLAAFFDAGNVYDTQAGGFEFNELRYSVGLGLSWLSPVGALTMSFSRPLVLKGADESEEFQFNLGRTF